MRVISGRARGTHLVSPEGDVTRPTLDRIKETLFNMIAFDMGGSKFLDLFSGSGAIGIESLSRGAQKAVFVEKDKNAVSCIRKNLEKTRLSDYAAIYSMDIFDALSQLKEQAEKFDIIFLDPPYLLPNIEKVLEKIEKYELLKEDGYIILERSTNTIVTLPQNLVLWKEKTYTTTTLSFMKKGIK